MAGVGQCFRSRPPRPPPSAHQLLGAPRSLFGLCRYDLKEVISAQPKKAPWGTQELVRGVWGSRGPRAETLTHPCHPWHPCNSNELQGCPAVRTRTSKKEEKEVCHQLHRGTGGILELALEFVKFLKSQVFPPPLGVPLGFSPLA